jgi:hypothetical protein
LRFEFAEQRVHARLQIARFRARELFFGTPQSRFEAFAVVRLKQIIDGVNVERFEREFFVRRHENNGRHLFGADRFYDREAVQLRHLHIQKNEIGFFLLDFFDRALPVAALANHFDLRIGSEQLQRAFTRERLIIDNQDTNLHLS